MHPSHCVICQPFRGCLVDSDHQFVVTSSTFFYKNHSAIYQSAAHVFACYNGHIQDCNACSRGLKWTRPSTRSLAKDVRNETNGIMCAYMCVLDTSFSGVLLGVGVALMLLCWSHKHHTIIDHSQGRHIMFILEILL